MIKHSCSPTGETFIIPTRDDYDEEIVKLEIRVAKERQEGKEIVVVIGVGFVGAVMAAIIADTTDSNGKSTKFVIGCQRPSIRS